MYSVDPVVRGIGILLLLISLLFASRLLGIRTWIIYLHARRKGFESDRAMDIACRKSPQHTEDGDRVIEVTTKEMEANSALLRKFGIPQVVRTTSEIVGHLYLILKLSFLSMSPYILDHRIRYFWMCGTILLLTWIGVFIWSENYRIREPYGSEGPFRWIRYPRELSNLIKWLGLGVFFVDLTFLLIAGIVAVSLSLVIKFLDSQHLRILGEPYQIYVSKTGALFPRIPT